MPASVPCACAFVWLSTVALQAERARADAKNSKRGSFMGELRGFGCLVWRRASTARVLSTNRPHLSANDPRFPSCREMARRIAKGSQDYAYGTSVRLHLSSRVLNAPGVR